MLTKLVVLVLVAGAAWFLFLRPVLARVRATLRGSAPRPTGRPDDSRPTGRAKDTGPAVALIACPDCGVYRDARQPCACQAPK